MWLRLLSLEITLEMWWSDSGKAQTYSAPILCRGLGWNTCKEEETSHGTSPGLCLPYIKWKRSNDTLFGLRSNSASATYHEQHLPFLSQSCTSCVGFEQCERLKEPMRKLFRSRKPNYIWFGPFLSLPKCFWQPNIAHKSVTPEPSSLGLTPVLLHNRSMVPGNDFISTVIGCHSAHLL